MKLYELTDEIRALEAMMEGDDVDEESFQAALDQLGIERDAKIANIGLLIKEWRADIDARKEAMQHLRQRNESAERRIRWMLDYLGQNLGVGDSVKTPVVTVRKQQGRMGLVVAPEAQLPDRFYRKEVNKTELKAAVDAGEEYHGVSIERGNPFVVVQA